MWDAWGGTSGVEWAIKKLEQIDGLDALLDELVEKMINLQKLKKKI